MMPAPLQPAWQDSDDGQLSVSLAGSSNRLRKLRESATESVVSGSTYEQRLRAQYEKLNPVPLWASQGRERLARRRKRSTATDDSASDSDGDGSEAADDVLRVASVGRKRTRRSGAIASGEIDIERLRDANQSVQRKDAVVNVGFHPSAQLMYCTTEDRRAQFFKVDGVDNALLQSFHAQELPISSAAIHPAGTTLLLTGRRPFFITCDLQSGAMSRSPRGLLNEGLGGSEGSDASGGGLDRFAFSPDGSQLAIAGRRGYVHLLAWNADGSGCGSHVIGRVKTNAAVRSIAWRRNGAELVTLCDDSCLYTWDVGTRRCISKRPDEGGFGACSLALDANDRYAAVGSSSGVVNVYEAADAFSRQDTPVSPLKSIENLTTQISSMAFNHDSQLLALSSRQLKDQLRLVHLPTATVFSNWPTQRTPLHHVSDIAFSRAGGEYLAIGNARGKVLLFSLRHYSASPTRVRL